MSGGQEPAVGEGQCLTTVAVAPPTGQGDVCLLADDGIPTEDLAAQLIPLFGVLRDTHIKHTVPGGAAGTVGVVRGGEEEARTPNSAE